MANADPWAVVVTGTVNPPWTVTPLSKPNALRPGMYHDALQSGLKAFGFDRGVTVQGGLTVPVTTTAHGSAFAIAGKNKANLDPILNSFKIALSMSQNKKN